nr:gamma-glutamyl phosphate reductase [Actinomycetota bacterium]
MPSLQESVAQEAAAAGEAVPQLADALVTAALSTAADRVPARRDSILAANDADVSGATDALDAGAIDRLRLDGPRLDAIEAQLRELAALPPLEREIDSWRLPNGLEVSERRIPIGVVGANFEARPNVAVDIAGQLLKGLNGAVLRTGGAALGTVTVLVDEVLRPALAEAGLPPDAVGLVRSPDREGARVL